MSTMKRRSFVKKAALATAATPMLWGTSNSWAGANDRVNVAVVGIRGQGKSHIRAYQQLKNVNVMALCDVDENLFPERVQEFFVDKGLPKPEQYYDIRKLLENKDIDAVSIVTPNHWHTLSSIWAVQAGKHVSVEKPSCHNFWEGQQLVKASKKYGKLIQDGAEQRSNPCAQTMADFLHAGKLGEVYLAKGICYKWRDTIGKTPDEPVPNGVHYDHWIGPAPKRPFSQNRFHYKWHWNWDYGNGDMGNQGVHEFDIARWGLGVKLPTKVSAIGGHLMFDDDQNTPNVLMAVMEFPDEKAGGDKKKIMQFEVRHWICNNEGQLSKGFNVKDEGGYMTSNVNVVGNLFYGSEGYMTKTVNDWKTYMGKNREPGSTGSGIGNHYQNFVDAIRANDESLLTAPIDEGFYTCANIHLANISYRVGRTINFDPVKQVIIGDEEASRLLTRDYREPYVVPEIKI